MPVAATREEGCSKCYGHEREGVARSGKDGRNRAECSLLSVFLSSGVSFLKSRLDDGKEGAAVLPEKRFHVTRV